MSGVISGYGNGLVIGLGAWWVSSATWTATLACAQRWHRGRLPRRLLRFLDDARDRQVLRTGGPVCRCAGVPVPARTAPRTACPAAHGHQRLAKGPPSTKAEATGPGNGQTTPLTTGDRPTGEWRIAQAHHVRHSDGHAGGTMFYRDRYWSRATAPGNCSDRNEIRPMWCQTALANYGGQCNHQYGSARFTTCQQKLPAASRLPGVTTAAPEVHCGSSRQDQAASAQA